MKKILAIYFLFFSVLPAISQGIGEISTQPAKPSLNQPFKVIVESNGELTNCGLQINLGDGSSKDIRAEKFPLYLDHTYKKEGVFSISVTGKLLIRGLSTALPCAGDLKSLAVNIEIQNLSAANTARTISSSTPTSQVANVLTNNQVTNKTLGNRRALVIGNDTYKSVAVLQNAREDARTMAANLTAAGYEVTLKLDLNEKEMKAAMRTFAGQVQGGDEVLFFFAGHGVQLGSTNYLLPTDIGGESEAQVRDEAIQLQRVLDDMSERKAKFTLAMIDACRDNPFKSSGRAIGGRGLAPTTAATGQMVIFSAGTGQQALDKLNNADKNKNGLFTRVFVQEMQKPNQSVDRVVKNVRNQVAELAKSVGHEQVPAIYDQVLGEFYFYQNASIAPSSDPPQRSQIIPIAENNTEVVFWNSVKDSNSVAEYQAYLTKYPRGMFTGIASSRIERLTKQATPTVVNNSREVENKSNQPDPGLLIFKNIMEQMLKDK